MIVGSFTLDVHIPVGTCIDKLQLFIHQALYT